MVVDASVWVSQFVPIDAHHVAARRWLDEAMAGDGWAPVVPAIALAEVAGAVARRTGVSVLGEQAAEAVLAVPGLRVVAIDVALGAEAARAAARLGLHCADAIYAAIARTLAVPLITLDEELRARTGGFIEVVAPA